uniref:Uncharacterized protein n=1 Tax=Salvator merianae TaxID=96440 RepID=A0A8D0DNY6_SALMN
LTKTGKNVFGKRPFQLYVSMFLCFYLQKSTCRKYGYLTQSKRCNNTGSGPMRYLKQVYCRFSILLRNSTNPPECCC